MRKGTFLIHVSIFWMITTPCLSQEVLQWRGNDRTGVFPETGLLKYWPPEGPSLLWEYYGIGNGYGSPVITSQNIFVNGEVDSINYLFALNLSGKFLWKAKIGKEWVAAYPGARSTPTIVGDLAYVTAGLGKLTCLELRTGKQRWSVEMVQDFHGKTPGFGFAESVLVDGDKVYCSPGSADTNVVALDRFTGKILWICKGTGEKTSYCSPMLIRLPQRIILVTFSMTTMLGIDTKDGKLLWSYKQDGQDIDCQVNTPLYEKGFLYIVNGNGNGAVKFRLSDDGTQITEIWRNNRCDGLTGGFIKINDYLYTSSYERRYFYSLDAKTGNITDSLKFDRGTVNLADGMLYFYNERGQMGLVKPEGPKMNLVSSFKITKGTKAHFAHPVINNGILYVRHGQSLLEYKVKN
jgi:outer membrane protein assembly factor BamB